MERIFKASASLLLGIIGLLVREQPAEAHEPSVDAREEVVHSAALERTFSGYEQIWAILAAGRIEGARTSATKLEASATAAISETHAKLAPHLEIITSAAARIQRASDLPSLRVAFAELSRGLIGLLATDSALASRWYVFECGSIRGFNKWAQRVPNVANPYLGNSFVPCAAPSAAN